MFDFYLVSHNYVKCLQWLHSHSNRQWFIFSILVFLKSSYLLAYSAKFFTCVVILQILRHLQNYFNKNFDKWTVASMTGVTVCVRWNWGCCHVHTGKYIVCVVSAWYRQQIHEWFQQNVQKLTVCKNLDLWKRKLYGMFFQHHGV